MMTPVALLPPSSRAPAFRRFHSTAGEHLLVVPHTRIFDLSPALAGALDADPNEAVRIAAMLGETSSSEASLSAVVMPAPQSLSLNISSSCNLSCGYCYADQGRFAGVQSNRMSRETALAAVNHLLAVADPAYPVTIGFLGGEPLLNRNLIHVVVRHASAEAYRRRLDIRFSITTNGTLVTADDIALMRAHRFALTVSIDGDQGAHDAQRPRADGKGSFARLQERLKPLLADPGRTQAAARMTVRRDRFDLQQRLDAIWAMGFREAGVAPLRVTADDSGLCEADWPNYLAELIGVARGELVRAASGLPIRLTNLAVALKQLHAGASSPYACGAGGGYFSAAADGQWYACHRAVGDEAFRLGTSEGLDEDKRRAFLEQRHVHAQTDCHSCWARYLCSGGCHQEAAARTAAGCDFIRDWLGFCLASYCELTSGRPDYFVSSTTV